MESNVGKKGWELHSRKVEEAHFSDLLSCCYERWTTWSSLQLQHSYVGTCSDYSTTQDSLIVREPKLSTYNECRAVVSGEHLYSAFLFVYSARNK